MLKHDLTQERHVCVCVYDTVLQNFFWFYDRNNSWQCLDHPLLYGDRTMADRMAGMSLITIRSF